MARRPGVGYLCFNLTLPGRGAPAAEDTQPAAGEVDKKPVEKHKLAFKFRPGQIVRQEITHDPEIKTHKNQDETGEFVAIEAYT